MIRPPPFRAEHIGSLVRPPELLRARQQHAAGTLDRENLAAIENAAIARVVKLQEELGLQVVTDGEFRRGTYSDAFTSAGISGVKIEMTRCLHQRRHFRREDRDDRGARLDQLAEPWPPDGAAHSNGRRAHRLERTAERR